MVSKTSYENIENYVTKDGSIIRELFHPDLHGNKNQSLAEAVVPVGGETLMHRHPRSEELYHFTQGIGLMILGEDRFPVEAGDTVCILPGRSHQVINTGGIPLKILCCCAPPYSHDDTIL